MAEEKPSNTAAAAIHGNTAALAGLSAAIAKIAAIISPCASSSQPRRCPKRRVSHGSGSASINGAQMNLKE